MSSTWALDVVRRDMVNSDIGAIGQIGWTHPRPYTKQIL